MHATSLTSTSLRVLNCAWSLEVGKGSSSPVLEVSVPKPAVSALAPEVEASLQAGEGSRISASEAEAPLSMSQ